MITNLLNVASEVDDGTFWMPVDASTVAGDIDFTFYLIYWLDVFFFFAVIGTMTYFAIKYRRKGKEAGPTHPLEGNVKLEVVWSVIPAILLVVIFASGFKGYMASAVAPGNSMNINVTATSWAWGFEYPGLPGNSPHLVVPVDRPVKLTMVSSDVLHSLFIPSFRTKQDVLPNRYTTLWFEATKVGEFDLYCTEYCGKGHSEMVSPRHIVKVLSQNEYARWEANGGPYGEVAGRVNSGEKTQEWAGKILFEQVYGCAQCHSLTEVKIGPALGDLSKKYADPKSIPNGHKEIQSYFKESIENPSAYIAPGGKGVMPTFKGRITNQEITWIYGYLKNPENAR